MAVRNGLLTAFEQVQEALDGIQELPNCGLIPLPPAAATLPAMYFFWDEENFSLEESDLKWIHPGNSRAHFKTVLYLEAQPNQSIAVQLIQKAQLIKNAITQATTDAREWKGNVIKVEPMYGSEGTRSWGGVQFTILIGEYL